MSVEGVAFSPSPIRREREECVSNPFTGRDWKQVRSSLIQTKDYLAPYLFTLEKWSSNTKAQSEDGRETAFPLSEDTDLEVIPDYVESQELHQIRKTDARYFLNLYEAIAEGKTRMKIEGSPAFKKKILEYVKILITRPLGRQLIGNICSMGRDVHIQKGETNITRTMNGKLFVYIDPNAQALVKCQDSQGEVTFEPAKGFMIFAHELIHALHRDALKAGPNGKSNLQNLHEKSPHPGFTNLSEQLTIAGLEDDGPLICENALRAEFGMGARVAHKISEFPSYTSDDRLEIDTPNEVGITRLKNAVDLKAHGEICTLLKAGANPGNAFAAAILNDDKEMVQFLLEQGADPRKPDNGGMIPLHWAAFLNRKEIVRLLIDWDVCLVQPDALGQTALDLALEENNLDCALLFITNGVPLTQKSLECLAHEYRKEFLASVPSSMDMTDKQLASRKPGKGASERSSKKRVRDSSDSQSDERADQPSNKRPRHREQTLNLLEIQEAIPIT